MEKLGLFLFILGIIGCLVSAGFIMTTNLFGIWNYVLTASILGVFIGATLVVYKEFAPQEKLTE